MSTRRKENGLLKKSCKRRDRKRKDVERTQKGKMDAKGRHGADEQRVKEELRKEEGLVAPKM
jgi:hypothetical protein